MKLKCTILLTILVFFAACSPKKADESAKTPPNIIYILADDLGYGDLSILGQQHFQTPNLDRLAAQGMLFTQHYSGSTVCAPSRSALMTGLHTGHTFIRGNKEAKPEGQHPIPPEALTVAEVLKAQGYRTGAFGKWGLGGPGTEGDPLKQGFDQFFGYNCQRLAHNYYPAYLWDNDQKVMLQGNEGTGEAVYAPQLIHQKTLEFIEANRDRPFFAFIPNVIPHAELKVPAAYLQAHAGKVGPEKPFKGCDAGCDAYKVGGYGSQDQPHAAFAGMVTLLDEQVGEIVAKLEALGLSDNTIIVFSSDNGPHQEAGADPVFFNSNGGVRGFKRDLYEGGIRAPMIVKWPAVVKPGTRTDHLSAFWDIFPTFAEIAGSAQKYPIDGISFLPTLKGLEQPKHDHLYWEFHEQGGKRAVRKNEWKLIELNVKTDQPERALYHLPSDPKEEQNVADQHPEIVQELWAIMQNRTTSAIENWNF